MQGKAERDVDTGDAGNNTNVERLRLTDLLGYNRVIVPILNRLNRSPVATADAAIDAALADLGMATGFDRTYVFCLRDDVILDNTHEWTAPSVHPMRSTLQGVPAEIVAHWQADFEQDRSVIIPSVQDLPPDRPERQFLLEQDIRSILVVPMLDQGRWIGFVGYDAVRQSATLREDHVLLLQSVADGIAALLLRGRAERALQQSRSQLSATLAAIPYLVIEFDREGRYRAVHSDRHGLLAQAPDTFIGRPTEEVITPELATLQRAMMAEADRSGGTLPQSYAYPLGDTFRWFEVIAAPRSDPSGAQNDGNVFLVRDLTSRMNAETALRSREALLADLFHQAPIGILLNDGKSGRLLDVNPAFLAASGRNRDDLDNRLVVDLMPPGQKRFSTGAVNALDQTGRYGPFETAFYRHDGTPYPVSVSGVTTTSADQRRLVWSFVVDLTEQRSNEAALRARTREALETRQQLEAALAAFPDAFVLFDAKDHLVLYNQQHPALYPAIADTIRPGARLADIIQAGLDCGMYASVDGKFAPTLAELLDHDPVNRQDSELELSDGRIIRIIEKNDAQRCSDRPAR